MSGNASDYLEGKVGDHIFRTSTFTKPTALYIALCTTAFAEDGTGGVEVSGGAYARVNLAPLDTNWSAPSAGNGTVSNLVAITFPTPTADWGTVVAWRIMDASSGGNQLFQGTLTASKTIHNGDSAPSFGVGAFVIVIS